MRSGNLEEKEEEKEGPNDAFLSSRSTKRMVVLQVLTASSSYSRVHSRFCAFIVMYLCVRSFSSYEFSPVPYLTAPALYALLLYAGDMLHHSVYYALFIYASIYTYIYIRVHCTAVCCTAPGNRDRDSGSASAFFKGASTEVRGALEKMRMREYVIAARRRRYCSVLC